MLKKILMVILSSVIVVLVLSACGSQETSNENTPTPTPTVGVKKGNLAPDFEFGEIINLEKPDITKLSDLKDKVVFLHFWTTTCFYCVKESPHIEYLRQKYISDDFVVITVSVDKDQDTVRNYLTENGYTFPVVLDISRQIAESYHIDSTPKTFIIDKDGIIRAVEIGYRNWSKDENQWLIDRFLSQSLKESDK